MDRDAFGLQIIKSVGQSIYILTFLFFILILADGIVIYFSFVIIYGNILKYITVTAQLLQWKLRLDTLKNTVPNDISYDISFYIIIRCFLSPSAVLLLHFPFVLVYL